MYAEASSEHGAFIRRLARGYEADPDKQRDLLQEIHLELWLSLAKFDGRCSLRTWMYRIAHNVGASHVDRSRRLSSRLVDLETLDVEISQAGDGWSAAILLDLVRRLKPFDRQIILLYLEGVDAAGIAEVTGISSGNVATKIHRLKNVLTRRFQAGGQS